MRQRTPLSKCGRISKSHLTFIVHEVPVERKTEGSILTHLKGKEE